MNHIVGFACFVLAGLLSFFAVPCAAGEGGSTEATKVTPIVIYASQSGKATLDQGDGGGNPFASALITLLQRPSLTL